MTAHMELEAPEGREIWMTDGWTDRQTDRETETVVR